MLDRAPVVKVAGGDDKRTQAAVGNGIDAALEALAQSAMGTAQLGALGRGDAAAFTGLLDWDNLTYQLNEALQMDLAGVFLSKGLAAMNDLSVTAVLDFELLEPRAINWATQQAGRRVVAVSSEVRAFVRQATVEALQGTAGDVYAVARRIRRVVPLTPRWATAVNNTYERTMSAAVQAGRTADQATAAATKAADKQAKRLLRVRSENIARTEIMTASNAGRYEGWAVQIGQGQAATDSRKEWMVGVNACSTCDPMNGEVVEWDKPFSAGFMMPPAHPSCRCTGVLLPPDVELRGPTGVDRPAPTKRPATQTSKPSSRSLKQPVSDPDLPPQKARPLNAGDITNDQGKAIAASAMRQARGEITPAQHRQFVRDLTNTDSRGYPLPGAPKTNVKPPAALAPAAPLVPASRQLPATSQETIDAMLPKRGGWTTKTRAATEAAMKKTPDGKVLLQTMRPFQSGGSTAIPRLRTDVEKYLAGAADLAPGRVQAIETLLSAAKSIPAPTKPLYRGMAIPGTAQEVLGRYLPGSNLDLSVSSFTSDKKTGVGFAMPGGQAGARLRAKGNTPVVVEWADEVKTAVPLENMSPSRVFSEEKEWVASGRFKVSEAKIVKRDGMDTVYMKIERTGEW